MEKKTSEALPPTPTQPVEIKEPLLMNEAATIRANYTLDDIAIEIIEYKDECSKKYDHNIEDALQQATGGGKNAATMPQLIAARTKAPDNHPVWHNWYTTTSEEDVGIDAEGHFGQKGNPVLVVVHGGGILTANRIKRARQEGFLNGAVRLTNEEISNLLTGKINDLPLYHFDDFKITKKLPDYYGIVLDFELAKHCKSNCQKVHTLKNDALFIARTGGIEHASQYLDRAVQVYNTQNYGNWHLFNRINPLQPQGCLLFLYCNSSCLYGYNDLTNYGRFVGVAPKAPQRALKK